MIQAIRWLNIRRLHRQKLRSALALIAIAAGVSLSIAVVTESNSLKAATRTFGRQVAGPAPLRVVGMTSRGGIDEGVLSRVAGTPGVAAAVPAVQAVTIAEDANRHETPVVAFGLDCRVEGIVGGFGCPPEALASIGDGAPPITSTVLKRELGPGGVVRTDTGRVALQGGLTLPLLDRFNFGRVAIFPLAVAQRRFARVGRLDVIYVKPAAGVSLNDVRGRLAAELGPRYAVLRSTDPPPGPDVTAGLKPLLSLIALLSLITGMLLIYNIVTLSIVEGRRELAITAAVGGGSRLIVGGVLVEAGITGLLGGILGAGAGVAMAHPVVASVSTFAERSIGLHVAVAVNPWLPLYGAALGLMVALLAAVVPARRACRLDVASELYGRAAIAEAAPRVAIWRTAILGGIGLAGVGATRVASHGGGLAAWQAPVDLLGLVVAIGCLITAVGSLAPVLCNRLRGLSAPSSRLVGLALANLARERRRTAAMAIAIGTSVGLATILAATVRSTHDASVSTTARTVGDRLVVSTVAITGMSEVEAKTPPQVISQLAHLPGVANLSTDVSVLTRVGSVEKVMVTASDQPVFPYTVDVGPSGAEVLSRGDVLVGSVLARRSHLRPGSQIVLDAPRGPARLRVGAVWNSLVGGGQSVVMPIATLTSIWGPQPPDAVYVTPARGVRVDELAARIRAAHLDPDLRVETAAQVADDTSRFIGTYLGPFWALQRALLIVALVAVLSTLLLIGSHRHRELGTLAAVGMSPRDLAALGLVEAGVVGVIGSVLAVATAIPLNEAILNNAVFLFGYRPPFSFDILSAVAYGTLALVVTVIGAMLPSWRMSRIPVLDALRYE